MPKINLHITCPMCDGEGGWTEVVDPWISGPYYPCEMCSEKGYISLWVWIQFHFWNHAPCWFCEFYADLRGWNDNA